MSKDWNRRVSGLLLAALVAAASCSNPEKEKVAHVKRGDQYAADRRDEFAAVEYAAAVKIDPKYGEARWKLAQTYERLGDLQAAFPEYVRAADALPNDREAQLKATRVLLLAGSFEDAKARVGALLQQNPKDVEAMLLQAAALASLRDANGSLAQIEEALKVNPESSEAYARLGVVRMQTGKAKEAEAAFRRAISLDPSSIEAKIALASFLWADGRMPEAEASIKDSLANQPQNVLANRMLAALYIATGRRKEAEQPLKVIADTSKNAAARLQLADYYIGVGRSKEARDLLGPLSSEPATFADAEMRLAALDYADGHVPEAHKRLDNVLAKAPKNTQALVMKSQWFTKENKLDEALDSAKAAVASDSQSATAQFALADVQDRRRDVTDAVKSYSEVLRLNPRATAAKVALSRLSLTSGDAAAALQYAEEASGTDPTNLDARAALVRGLLASRNVQKAETEVAVLLKDAPESPVPHALNGSLEAIKNNTAAARKSFERALELLPGYLDALAGLTNLDLAAQDPQRAIARLEPEIAKQPNSGPLLVLLARSQSATKDDAKAEQTLRRAVSVDSRCIDCYVTLALLYARQGRMDEARAQFETIGQHDPSAMGARTMVGILFDLQGRHDEAKKSYESLVGSPEKAPIAANNLAFIYADQGTKLDVALQLATTAKQQMPNEPSIDDTIGWIYYKKDLPALAVQPLEDSLKKRPDKPEVLYHLGLAYAKLGEKAKSRATLEHALKLDPKVGGDDARRVLADVSR